METSAPKSRVRDFFLYLLTIIALYFSVGTFINMLFEYIDYLFPDKAQYYSFISSSNSIRFSVATLLIVFPIYIGLSWFLRKDAINHPEKRDFGFRKVLIYFTLFIAAITIAVDLVTLIYNFLEGELSVRFFLKILVVFVVAGSVFSYYLWDLKRETLPTSHPSKIIAWSVSSVVLASIIASFFIIGSPFTQRLRRFDEMRVNDLQMVQNQVMQYWNIKRQLPANLNAITDNISGFQIPKDPDTAAPYEYNVKGSLSFELCANFALKSDKESGLNTVPIYEPYGENWNHAAGHVCFLRTINPDLYPPYSQPGKF